MDDGSKVNEASPTVAVGAGPSTDKLLAAEKAALSVSTQVHFCAFVLHCTAFTQQGREKRVWGCGEVGSLVRSAATK